MPRLSGRRLLVAMLLMAVFRAGPSIAENVTWAGRTGASLKSGADSVDVIVTTCQLKDESCVDWRAWTDSLALKANIVSSITIRVNGVAVWVPHSTWADALSPVRLKLSSAGEHRFRLTLDCGDGAYTDREEILFTRHRVTLRRVLDPQSNKVVEQTTYY